MIKRLILITGILLSTSLWASPMDKICPVYLNENYWEPKNSLYISRNCERNNILNIYGIDDSQVTRIIAMYCRYDRNATTQSTVQTIGEDKGEIFIDLTCILYDRFARREKELEY
mgnify:CR=1 FL=1|tara:strand:- start:32 stop:376 length:345 start_codon:yes stop_codon:yes gene_type:complete